MGIHASLLLCACWCRRLVDRLARVAMWYAQIRGWPSPQALLGREDGHMHYAESSLLTSSTAAWLLGAVDTMESAYAQLQFLFTPSKFQVGGVDLACIPVGRTVRGS